MGDVGGIPEDAYDDMITDENERRKLQGYNINKEMKINTTRMSRKLDDNLLCRCEGHKTQRCSEMCTKTNWWREEHACQARRSGNRAEPRSVAWWSAEGAWLRGMDSGHVGERLTSRQIRARDTGPVHRVWYK